jgi:O-methyltransferase involved in polyketide biosynthesis
MTPNQDLQKDMPVTDTAMALDGLAPFLKESKPAIQNTSLPTAINRALMTDISFAREIAEAAGVNLAEHAGIVNEARTDAARGTLFGASYCMLDGRYRSMDEALAKLAPEGVLELAAGHSPRGIATAGTYSLYVETDLADLVAQKREIVEALKPDRDPSQHIIRPLNALHGSDLIAAGALFEEKNISNIALTHEGLFFYLTRDEQKVMRDNVAAFLKQFSPNGAWVSPDFVYDARLDEETTVMRATYERSAGRPWTTFSTDDEIREFMRDGGLKVEFLGNDHLVGMLESARRSGATNPDHVSRWLRECRVAVVRLVGP